MIEHREKFKKACDDFMKELNRTLHFTQFTKWLIDKFNNMLK
ncbi:hypothetical protein [Macrococcus capreoli]|nr:hypothetical protein [Macrococcus sp. TMW 2.2395]MCU7557273.1 hypothetical protein [Macrococcus sp. TMW 2.2395]